MESQMKVLNNKYKVTELSYSLFQCYGADDSQAPLTSWFFQCLWTDVLYILPSFYCKDSFIPGLVYFYYGNSQQSFI